MKELNKYLLKKQLNELLNAGKEISLDFNCGNDEAHIVPFIDGKMVEYGDLYSNLEELIYTDLNLPSNGEFMVTGSGYLTLEENNIYLFYDLQGFTYVWDEDDDVCNSEDYEPKKDITDKMKEKHLLLSSDLDDYENSEEYLESINPSTTVGSMQNNFTNSDQKIWNELKGEQPKPWWKFW